MDILFICSTSKLQLNNIPNGTMLLATKLLQAGFDVDVLHFAQIDHSKGYNNFLDEITERILERDPKCVSFYTLWPYYHIILRIAQRVKERKNSIHIILGGPQASATAEETMKKMDFVDHICTGEGENTVVPFFTALLQNGDLASIPGLYYRKQGAITCNAMTIPLCDLNTLPYWDDRLLNAWDPQQEEHIRSKYYLMPIDAGRGCPFNCTFCCSSHFWKRTYRLKSADQIIRDILFYKQKFGIQSFRFSHDAFTTNTKLVSEVCDRITEAGLDITWGCTTRINCINEELILKMKQTGLFQIEVGIETGSPRMQKKINKKLDLDRAKELVRFMLDNGLTVYTFFMYGFPEETEEDLSQTLDYMFDFIDLGASATMNICQFNPTTQLTTEYFDKLTLNPDMKILSRAVFGYKEELPVIQSNKALFPFFYNLDIPLREKFQYLFFFKRLYEDHRESMYFLRKLYKGDNLQFYLDFYNSNRDIFVDMRTAPDMLRSHAFQIAENIVDTYWAPYAQKLKALFRFNEDLCQVKASKEDIRIQKTYDFSYLDYHKKLPIEKFSNYKTTLLIQKIDDKLTVNMLDIQPLD